MKQPIELFELCGKDRDVRFSPYAWRIKMALMHKRLSFEPVACGFLEKQAFAQSGSNTVPVLHDGDVWMGESWDIACYLEDTYAEAPSLFGGQVGRGAAHFFSIWADMNLLMPIFPIIVADIVTLFGDTDRAYFETTREKRLGMPIADTLKTREKNLESLHHHLRPLRALLKTQKFIAGKAPAHTDYLAFGCFQWARLTSPVNLLEGEDHIYAWRERMLDLFDGFGRAAKPGHQGQAQDSLT
jgi:glutathione S-transferase